MHGSPQECQKLSSWSDQNLLAKLANTFWLYIASYMYIVPKLPHMNSKVISSIPTSHSTHATEDCEEWLSGDQMLLFLDFVCIIAL